MRAVSLIEPLEDRIAPAALVAIGANGKSATYTDASGDTVVVTTTKGAFNSSQFTFDPNTAGQLTELSVANNTAFNGAAITFTVFPVSGNPHGSASVNVGYIDASGIGLGSVTIPGDLGRIDAGGGSSATAIGKLTIQSLGALDTTQGGLTFPSSAFYDTTSNLTGTVGQVNIAGSLDGVLFAQDFKGHPGTGNILGLNVGGSINGDYGFAIPNTSPQTYWYGGGQVVFTGSLGTAVIGGGIDGGPLAYSGSIAGYTSTTGGLGSLSRIGSVIVKGSVPNDPNPNPVPGQAGTSILGGSGLASGGIIAGTVGSVTVAGDVFGGTGTGSGFIQGASYLKTVNINGSLLGGNITAGSPTEANSAGVISGLTIGTVTIGKNLYGGSGLDSGEIFSIGTVHKVVVMGDIGGGTAGTSSTFGDAGSIRAEALGSVTVMGSLIGGNLVSGVPTQAASGGALISSATTLGSVYIGGNVIGSTGADTAEISSGFGYNTGSITIAGAEGIIGGAGASSGFLSAGNNLGTLIVKGSIVGGAGENSGSVQIGNNLNSLALAGNLTGGTTSFTGDFTTFGSLVHGTIGGNITGSNNSGTAILSNTGYIQANAIGTLNVGGNLTSGIKESGAGALDTCGAIRSNTFITSLTLTGIIGNSTNPAIISAVGPANVPYGATSDVAIGSLTVNGAVSWGDILAGYNTNTQNSTVLTGTGVNANAQIGTVTIHRTLSATNIIAGVGLGTNGDFGNSSSALLSGAGVTNLPSIVSKISRIVVTSTVDQPTSTSTDTFGIAAQYIVSGSIDGTALKLTPGADNDTFANSAEQTLSSGSNGGNTILYEV
jgi:hypothetical protein